MLKLQQITGFLLANVLMVITSYAYQSGALSTLPNPGLSLLKQATLIKAVAPETAISFTVWLKLRNKPDLDQLTQDVYNVKSSRYHQFLTKTQYEKEFAPSKTTEDTVKQFFISQGMQAKIVNHSVKITGTAGQIERSLHTKINFYKYKNEIFYANASAPKVKFEIAQYIFGVTGLSTRPEFHSNLLHANNNQKMYHDLNFSWKNYIPTAVPTDISLQGFSGQNLQKTYSLSNIPLVQGVRLNGAGQTLVIVDKCGTNGPAAILSDANQYFNLNSITPFVTAGPAMNFAIVNSDGTPFTTCPSASSFSQEILLDIESSHTIAPGDNTLLVLGSNQRAVLMDVISQLIQNDKTFAGFANAAVISNSWSDPESGGVDSALESSLQLAAAAGISVNFSSGDCGDNTYSTQSKCTGFSPSSPVVDYPSSSPYVTAVGATALFVDSHYRYAFETVWGKVKRVSGVYSYDGGTGGGISQYYSAVTGQAAIGSFTAGGYGVINSFGGRRALPDIAMLGDPQTGLLIIANGVQVQDGGTSLACPLFSATLVLVNQARNLLNKTTSIGQAAPYLYQMNQLLLSSRALRLIVPPAVIISGATPPPAVTIQGSPAPASAFTINNVTFGWDSSLTVSPENQFWNDSVGVGSPDLPNFVLTMANM